MKIKSFCLTFLFLIIGLYNNLFASSFTKEELTGLDLSDSVFEFLESKDVHPEKQQLLRSGINTFPYNILVKINSKKYSSQNIIFTFFQEDVSSNKNVIFNFINYVKNQNYDFNTIFLFSYGEKQKIQKKNMIYGIDSFLKTINSNDDYTAIIFDLSSDKNSIVANSDGITAPSWLVQNEYNTFIKYDIDENIPFFYLSQLYTNSFFYNRILTSFFKFNVPAIKLNLSKENVYDKLILNVLKDSIGEYSKETNRVWDHHFFLLRLFNHFKKFTENRTVQSIIIIIFIWLLFLLLFIFINNKLKNQTWATVKHVWYSVPITFILVYLGFFAGKYCFLAFSKSNISIKNTFTLFELQLIFSLILTSAYYLITLLLNYRFYEKTIDYLIVISCFFNQSLFILIDISIFPLFLIVCLLSILSLIIKNNGVHIGIFFLMLLVFVPYILSVINYANFDALYNFLISNQKVPFIISLVIYPSFLIYFRILTSMRKSKKINLSLITITIVIVLSTSAIIFGNITANLLQKKHEQTNKDTIVTTTEDLIDFNNSETYVFDDLIRTININFKEQPIQCSIYVTSFSKSPILYTENDFDKLKTTSAVLNTPYYPPTNITFKYGAPKEPAIIKVFAVFPTEEDHKYKSIKKAVSIGR